MTYFLTPEFHRNLWLKMSPFRLVAAPVFLLLAAYLELGRRARHLASAMP